MPPSIIQPQRGEAELRIGIVIARFNELITNRLLDGALMALKGHTVPDESIELAYVPGSFEVGAAALALAQSGRYDAIVCIGAVIRGETAHFDYVSMAVTQSVSRVSLETGVPCLFGVLTTDTLEQALSRSGASDTNRGYSAAEGAIEMAMLLREIRET